MTEDLDVMNESNFLRRAILDDLALSRGEAKEAQAKYDKRQNESSKMYAKEIAALSRIADLLEQLIAKGTS